VQPDRLVAISSEKGIDTLQVPRSGCTQTARTSSRTEHDKEVVPMAATLATARRLPMPCAGISGHVSPSGNLPLAYANDQEWTRPGAAMT